MNNITTRSVICAEPNGGISNHHLIRPAMNVPVHKPTAKLSPGCKWKLFGKSKDPNYNAVWTGVKTKDILGFKRGSDTTPLRIDPVLELCDGCTLIGAGGRRSQIQRRKTGKRRAGGRRKTLKN